MVKKISKLLISLVLISFLSPNIFAADKTSNAVIPLDGVVAKVNNDVITESELDKNIDTFKQQATADKMELPAYPVLRRQTLDELINKKIQMQIAEQAGIEASDADVQKALELLANRNHVSVPEFYQLLAKQGINLNDYKQELHSEIILQKLAEQEVRPRTFVSPQEVDAFMRSSVWKDNSDREYHLKYILIGLPENPSAQQIQAKKNFAEQVLAKIHKGLNFDRASMVDSSGAKALQGGDLGWRKLPSVPDAYVNDVIHMNKGDIAGPIRTPNGFHIIKLVDVRDTGSVSNPNADIRQQVQQLLTQRKYEEALQDWVMGLRAKAYVKIYDVPQPFSDDND